MASLSLLLSSLVWGQKSGGQTAGAPSQDWSPRGLGGAGFLTLPWLHLVSLVTGCGCSMCPVDVPAAFQGV